MKPTQRAYAAAFFDGEGGLYSASAGDHRWLVRIYQNDPTPLQKIQSWFGGGQIYKSNNGQSIFCIGTQREVLRFCLAIQPHTIVKRKLVRRVIREIRARHPKW